MRPWMRSIRASRFKGQDPREFLDRYITSRDQARSIGNQLGDLLNGLSTNEDTIDGAGDQVIAAVALAHSGRARH